MKIRDGYATLNGDKTEHTMPSNSLDIIADDGRTLFGITLNKDGTIRLDTGHVCKHQGILLDDQIQLRPIASNAVLVLRPEYPKQT